MRGLARDVSDRIRAHSREFAQVLAGRLPLGRPGAELLSDLQHLLEGLAAAVELSSTGLVDRHLEWQKVRTAALGGVPDCLVQVPGVLLELLEPVLDTRSYALVDQVLRNAVAFVRHAPVGRAPRVADDSPPEYVPACQAFLAAAMAGDRLAACAVLDEALPVADLVDHVLVPAQREIGRRWMMGAVAPAEEHLVSAIVHDCLLGLHNRLPAIAADAPLVFLVRPRQDEHSLGQAMFELFLRLEGLHVRTAVAADAAATVERFVSSGADAVAISCTTLASVRSTVDLIDAIRQCHELAAIPVLVGGSLFTEVPQLATQIGADAGGGGGRAAAALVRAMLAGVRRAPLTAR